MRLSPLILFSSWVQALSNIHPKEFICRVCLCAALDVQPSFLSRATLCVCLCLAASVRWGRDVVSMASLGANILPLSSPWWRQRVRLFRRREGVGVEGGEKWIMGLPCVAQCQGRTHTGRHTLSKTNTLSHKQSHASARVNIHQTFTQICCQTWGQDGASATGQGDRVTHL